MLYIPVVEPEGRIKRCYLHDTHMSEPERVVDAIMKSLNVANLSSAGLGAPFVEGLINCE